jgi:hypothetical protein
MVKIGFVVRIEKHIHGAHKTVNSMKIFYNGEEVYSHEWAFGHPNDECPFNVHQLEKLLDGIHKKIINLVPSE